MSKLPSPHWNNPIHILAFGFGSGAAPKAPGTWGTLVGLILYFALAELPLLWYISAIVVAFIFGVYICGKTASDLGVHDHGGIVWDEFVGLWITLIAVPSGWPWLVAGFVLFRFFDILKPWPIRWADQQLSGGFGIMFDDVLAGVYALIILQLAAFLLI